MKKVASEMTRKVVYALESDYLDDVWYSMRGIGVRHIPVLKDHKVVGILSDRDILRWGKQKKSGGLYVPHRLIGDLMTHPVRTCTLNDSIGKVAETMLEHKIDALPVTAENGDLIGIITSTDLLRLVSEKGGDLLQELPFPWDPEGLQKEHWRPLSN